MSQSTSNIESSSQNKTHEENYYKNRFLYSCDDSTTQFTEFPTKSEECKNYENPKRDKYPRNELDLANQGHYLVCSMNDLEHRDIHNTSNIPDYAMQNIPSNTHSDRNTTQSSRQRVVLQQQSDQGFVIPCTIEKDKQLESCFYSSNSPQAINNNNFQASLADNKHWVRRRVKNTINHDNSVYAQSSNNDNNIACKTHGSVYSDRRSQNNFPSAPVKCDHDVLTRPSWCNAQFAYEQVCQVII